MKINLLDNHFFIFFLFILTAIVTTISSIYFFSIMLSGILFLGFKKCLQNRSYYSLSFIILSFLFVELNNGFKPFSLVLLSTFVYLFVVPYLKRVISFNDLNNYVYILCFYAGLGGLWVLTHESSFYLFGTLIVNVLIDFIIFGFFI